MCPFSFFPSSINRFLVGLVVRKMYDGPAVGDITLGIGWDKMMQMVKEELKSIIQKCSFELKNPKEEKRKERKNSVFSRSNPPRERRGEGGERKEKKQREKRRGIGRRREEEVVVRSRREGRKEGRKREEIKKTRGKSFCRTNKK